MMMTKSPQAWHVDSIPWQEIGSDGTKYALLEGRRDIAGEAFIYAFFIPAGFWDSPHSHTADARIVVLKGTLYLGYSTQNDEQKLQAFGLGSYALVPANMPHFDGSFEDTIIIGTAIGAWSTHYVDQNITPSSGTT